MSSVKRQMRTSGGIPAATELEFDREEISRWVGGVRRDTDYLESTVASSRSSHERTLVLLNRISWAVVFMVSIQGLLAIGAVVLTALFFGKANRALDTVTSHLNPAALDAVINDGLGSVRDVRASTLSVKHGASQIDDAVSSISSALALTRELINATNVFGQNVLRNPDLHLHLGAKV